MANQKTINFLCKATENLQLGKDNLVPVITQIWERSMAWEKKDGGSTSFKSLNGCMFCGSMWRFGRCKMKISSHKYRMKKLKKKLEQNKMTLSSFKKAELLYLQKRKDNLLLTTCLICGKKTKVALKKPMKEDVGDSLPVASHISNISSVMKNKKKKPPKVAFSGLCPDAVSQAQQRLAEQESKISSNFEIHKEVTDKTDNLINLDEQNPFGVNIGIEENASFVHPKLLKGAKNILTFQKSLSEDIGNEGDKSLNIVKSTVKTAVAPITADKESVKMGVVAGEKKKKNMKRRNSNAKNTPVGGSQGNSLQFRTDSPLTGLQDLSKLKNSNNIPESGSNRSNMNLSGKRKLNESLGNDHNDNSKKKNKCESSKNILPLINLSEDNGNEIDLSLNIVKSIEITAVPPITGDRESVEIVKVESGKNKKIRKRRNRNATNISVRGSQGNSSQLGTDRQSQLTGLQNVPKLKKSKNISQTESNRSKVNLSGKHKLNETRRNHNKTKKTKSLVSEFLALI